MEPLQKLQAKKAKDYAIWTDEASQKIIDVDLGKRVVTGIYNTANYFDTDFDVMLAGSSTKSINERGPASVAVQKIKHLKDHDWGQIAAKILTLSEKQVNIEGQQVWGTYFEAKMANTALGNDLLINYQEGLIDNHSIGFRYLEGEYIEEGGEKWAKMLDTLINPQEAEAVGFMFVWKEIKLYEGSSVAFGANSLTPYLGVKSQNKELLALKVTERITLLEKQLRNGAQTQEALQEMEMQCLQLKQLINELFINAAEQDIKTTLKTEGQPENLQSSLLESIKDLKL